MLRVHGELNQLHRHPERPVPLPRAARPVPVALPGARSLPHRSLGHVLGERRSSYAFGLEQPVMAEVADLLRWSLGAQRTIPLPAGGRHRAGMAPSAGGLPSLDVWLVARGAGGLAPGVHHAAVRDADHQVASTLTQTHVGDPTAYLASALDQPQFATGATVFVVLAARLSATLPVYGPRHYRTLHLDAGIALQNLYLVSAALGLPGCAVSGFDDDAVAALLELADDSVPVAVFACGGGVRAGQ